ncbi:MAG: hypothetical protein Ct9H300mP28_33030 [Pseudomonadota bacterium]|nr:MAG: hypothetical protein Ct9H300mP28_33030 [Pseudomonadota bacterium]
METRARKTEGGFRLTGNKMWISNSPVPGYFLVWAKNDDGVIKGYILKKKMEGLSTPKLGVKCLCVL